MKTLLRFLAYSLLFFVVLPVVGDTSSIAHAGLSLAAGALATYGDASGWRINLPGVQFNGIDIEVWKRYIIEKFRKDNSFMFLSKDDSAYVLNGAVVHIPQAGADPAIVKNRNAFPAAAVRRTDTDVTYTLDNYSTDPTHLPFAELETLSYDKLDSVLGSHVSALSELIADDLLIKWSPESTQMVPTTGGSGALTQAAVAGQVGTRKALHHKDIQSAMIRMNIDNIPKQGRVLLIDDNMYGAFYDSLTDTQVNSFQQLADNRTGLVGRIHGFDVYTRSSVLAYTSGNVVKALGAALAATDNLASLAWHPNCVTRAVGEMKPFQDKDNPLYYGDLYSMLVRMGGRKERNDKLGVYAIVQAS